MGIRSRQSAPGGDNVRKPLTCEEKPCRPERPTRRATLHATGMTGAVSGKRALETSDTGFLKASSTFRLS